jgi:hypothetical protein
MTTLLDALNQSTTITPGGSSPGVGSTSQVAQLLKAKTGKAVDFGMGGVPSATPQMSTLGEASAVATAGNQLRQTQQVAGAQNQQLQQQSAQVVAEAAAQKQKVESARLDSIQHRADQTAALIQEYKQSRGRLGVEQQKALGQQLGFNARLSSEKYVDQLERAGAEQRLSTEIGFREALAKDIFHEEEGLFSEQFHANELLNMKQNQWNEWLGQIDINTAVALAGGRAAAANQQAMWTGAGNLAGAGVDAYGQNHSGAYNNDYQDYRSSGGTKGYSSWNDENGNF